MMLTFALLAFFLISSYGQNLKKYSEEEASSTCDCYNQGNDFQWAVKVEGINGSVKLGALLTQWHVLTATEGVNEAFPKGSKAHEVQRYEFHPYANFAVLTLRTPVAIRSRVCASTKTPLVGLPETLTILTSCNGKTKVREGTLMKSEKCMELGSGESTNRTLDMTDFCLDISSNKEDECFEGKDWFRCSLL